MYSPKFIGRGLVVMVLRGKEFNATIVSRGPRGDQGQDAPHAWILRASRADADIRAPAVPLPHHAMASASYPPTARLSPGSPLDFGPPKL